MSGWIGVDLDGTLVHYEAGAFNAAEVGEGVPAMVERVKRWLAEGKDVRIFTARASHPELCPPIDDFCRRTFGRELPITNVKDFQMIELWDDRAVQVRMNTGEPVGYSTRGLS